MKSALGEQKAVILDKWKLIVDLANGREAFYDIDHDGQIETTQSLPAPDRQEQMRWTLASVVEAASQDGAELEAIDPDTLKQLRSLGYLR